MSPKIEDKDGYQYFDLKQELYELGLLDLLNERMIETLVSKAIEANFALGYRMMANDGHVYFQLEGKYDILARLVVIIQGWLKLGFSSTN